MSQTDESIRQINSSPQTAPQPQTQPGVQTAMAGPSQRSPQKQWQPPVQQPMPQSYSPFAQIPVQNRMTTRSMSRLYANRRILESQSHSAEPTHPSEENDAESASPSICKICRENVDPITHRIVESGIGVGYNYFCENRGTQGYLCVECLYNVYPHFPNGCPECGVWRNCRPVHLTYLEWFQENLMNGFYRVLKYSHFVLMIVLFYTNMELIYGMRTRGVVVHGSRYCVLLLVLN